MSTATTRSPVDEDQPLLSGSPKNSRRKSSWRRLRGHLSEDVSLQNTDRLLLYAYFLTGLLDTSATAIWGTFVSMQTGNTVFLALGIAGPATTTRWIKSGMSLLAFWLGSFFFARLHYALSPRRRWILMASVVVQVLCIIAAALMVSFTTFSDPVNDSGDLHWHVLLPLALVAFQSSGQAVVSRVLRHRTLTSVALTSLYCDLFMDSELFVGLGTNIERNRRVAAVVLLFGGSLAGGAWSRAGIGMIGALWTAVLLKSLYIVAWFVWRKEKEEEIEQDEA